MILLLAAHAASFCRRLFSRTGGGVHSLGLDKGQVFGKRVKFACSPLRATGDAQLGTAVTLTHRM